MTPYEITILAAGIQRTLFAQTEREAALMGESVLRRFEGKLGLIGFWIDAPDKGALKRLGAYLSSVLTEMMGTGEVVA
ncbi:hypothetical protein MKK55_26870 [Methylobacterium sp. J-059]|uniref:hypothetical protein n=1 Tax=Methylobacterium sp. J-059 TaxID=2836643 RepID=UPI001FBBCBE4|nr:hypothetical protein [Methylobacterium sp. J-059]MCJ2042543.1 hypothetical protein [Methylobacterium sp. J-059]